MKNYQKSKETKAWERKMEALVKKYITEGHKYMEEKLGKEVHASLDEKCKHLPSWRRCD